jgi:hypothetical protein
MQPDPDSRTDAEAGRVEDGILTASGLALGAALIHAAAAVVHLPHYWPEGAFFAVLAAGQTALSVGLYRSKRSYPLVLAIVTSISVAMLWVLSRTSGLPVGPEPWRPEPVGPVDVIASADEVVLALLAALQLRALSPRATVVACKRFAVGLGVVLIMLSALVVSGIKHTHPGAGLAAVGGAGAGGQHGLLCLIRPDRDYAGTVGRRGRDAPNP